MRPALLLPGDQPDRIAKTRQDLGPGPGDQPLVELRVDAIGMGLTAEDLEAGHRDRAVL